MILSIFVLLIVVFLALLARTYSQRNRLNKVYELQASIVKLLVGRNRELGEKLFLKECCFNTTSNTLKDIASQNHGDPWFEIWAKKRAQDTITLVNQWIAADSKNN
jgi:hypothetical protein